MDLRFTSLSFIFLFSTYRFSLFIYVQKNRKNRYFSYGFSSFINLFYLDYLLIKVGRVRFELTMYLTSRFYRPLASAFCIPADSKFMTMYILHTMNCIISTHRETRTLTLSQLFLRQPCLPFPPYGHIEGEG